MDNVSYLNGIIQRMSELRENEFVENNFSFQEKELVKKIVNENTLDFKNFQIKLRKKASLDKMKAGNAKKKEYSTVNENTDIDIIKDDIFNNGQVEDNDQEKLDISSLDKDKKLELINNFIQKKSIFLDEESMKKIEEIIDNSEISLRKYIIISKMYQEITKINFIKKLEDGSYVVDLGENKNKKVKKSFFK